jgi:hypothetical protein
MLPKLLLGQPAVLAGKLVFYYYAKQELCIKVGSQAGAWEPVHKISGRMIADL